MMEADPKIIIDCNIDYDAVQEGVRRKNEEKEAFEWAVREQRKYGCVSLMSNLKDKDDYVPGENDCYEKNGYVVKGDDCVFSIFVGHRENGTKRVILRLDWPEIMSFEYRELMNYDYLCETSPKSIKNMKANGIRLFKEFEESGYRFMDEW